MTPRTSQPTRRLIAIYRCLKESCGHQYSHPHQATTCPKCKGKYVKWLSFEDDMRRLGRL